MPKKRITTSQEKNNKKFIHKIKIDNKSVKKMFKKTIIHKIARQTGFIKRKRKLDAFDFFLSVTFGALKSSVVTASGIIEELSKEITRTSVNERFDENACQFFEEVYSHFFKILNAAKKDINVDLFKKFNEIKIIDSSSWKVPQALKEAFPGCNKAGCKIQLMMNIKAGAISLFDLTKETTNDQSYSKGMVKNIEAHDLCLFDLGYVVIKTIIAIHKKTAFFCHVLILRALPFTSKKGINSIRLIF